MHFLRAAVALMVAMTFSLAVRGQATHAPHTSQAPQAPQTPKIVIAGKAATRSLWPTEAVAGTKVPRYKKTEIAGIAEINPETCAFINSGMWALTLKPTFGNFSWKVVSGTAATGQPCAGHTYNFATVFYKWTEHTNHTTTPHQGPTDIFNATWSTPDGMFNDPFVFHIVVDVVRPRGETSTLVSWLGTKGIWEVTLQCCDAGNNGDPNFDFTGETVFETFLTDDNSCPDIVGLPTLPTTGTVNSGPPGLFHDRVGFDPCVVHYERCIKKAGCGFVIKQQMGINSPADPPNAFTDYGSAPNTLSSRIEGSIIGTKGTRPAFFGSGIVTSQRSTPLSQNDPVSHDFVSSKNSCLAGGTDFLLFLRMKFSPC